MKNIYFAALLFTTALTFNIKNSTYADFVGAMDNYAKGEYEIAYKEFLQLAAVGNAEAIYNIGVMHYQGEYVEKDPAKAYAWMRIANSFDSAYTTITVKNKLTNVQFDESEVIYSDLNDLYSQQSYVKNLEPFICSREDYNQSAQPIYTAIKKIEPKAPSTARRKQVNGYINVGFSIDHQGNVVDVDLLDEFPRGLGYAVETIRAVKKFKYPSFKIQSDQVPLRYATYNISFHTKQWSKIQAEHSKVSVAKFIEMANANNSRAQYLLATAVPGLYKAKIDSKKRNDLLVLSAQNGYNQAQLLIGLRLVQDTKCRGSRDKGESWIKIAAENGNEVAQKYVDNFINF